jgi:hypothetical protein
MNRRRFLSALAAVPVAASLPAKATPVPKVVNVAGYDCMTTAGGGGDWAYKEYSRGFSIHSPDGSTKHFDEIARKAREHNNRRVQASGWKFQLEDIC